MTAPGGYVLNQAELASLTRVSGIPLASYRPAHVASCVARALSRNGVSSGADLAALCQRSPAALAALRRSILVAVTGLFRDPEQFDLLEADILPRLIRPGHGVRVWSAGCSDGSELYSVALVLGRLGVLPRSRLLGSDALSERVETARRGAAVPADVFRETRALVRWERRDLLREPLPSGRFDLVLCRNVAIYFAPPAQRELHTRLAAAVRSGGMIMLGRSERLTRPGQFGLTAVAPHVYQKDAPCAAA
jgi:chemotaxis protein methyltransferase CheR